MTTENKKSNGFTVVELIIAIVIIGILATIAIPNYLNSIRKSRIMARAVPVLRLIIAAEQAYSLKRDFQFNIAAGDANTALWDSLGLDVPHDTHYNYGFKSPAPGGGSVIEDLGSPGAYAMPQPYTTTQWGNPAYHQVGVTVDGKIGFKDSNGSFEKW